MVWFSTQICAPPPPPPPQVDLGQLASRQSGSSVVSRYIQLQIQLRHTPVGVGSRYRVMGGHWREK